MRYHSQVLGMVFAALVLVTVSQPAHAYLYTGWSASPTISDPGNDAGGGAKDITGIWYAKDTSYQYFRMDLAGAITSSDHANLYSILLNTNPNAVTAFTLTGNGFLHLPLYADFGLFPDTNGVANRLEWKIAKTDLTLPDIFTLKGTTSDLSFHPFPFAVKDSTGSFTTPIPSAVWLLGSGLLGLIGLQRRRGRKLGCL
jgi:hypothetical protein